MNFPIQEMPENPIDKGVNRSFDLYSKLLQALAAPEIMKSEQAQRKAALEHQSIINQFLPQQKQSEINLRTSQAPYYDAQTAETKERTREMPDELTIKEQNLYGDAQKTALSNARFNNTIYKLGNFLKTDIGKSLYVNDKQFAESATRMMRGLATDDDQNYIGSKIGGSNSTGGIPPSLIPAFAKLIGMTQGAPGQPSPMGMPSPQNSGQPSPQPMGNQQQPQQPPQQGPVPQMAISPDQAQALQNSSQAAPLGVLAPQQQSPAPMSAAQPARSGPIEAPHPNLQPAVDTMNKTLESSGLPSDVVDQVREKLSDMIEKKSTTTAVLNQRQFANIFNGLLKQAQPYLKSVYGYSGIKGKSKLAFDKTLAATGLHTNPDLENYIDFETVQKPLLAADLRRKLGGQATDREIADMLNIIDPSQQWFFNEKIASSRMEALKNASNVADRELAKGNTAAKNSLVNADTGKGPGQIFEMDKTGHSREYQTKKINGKFMVQDPDTGKWMSLEDFK